jgi:hypothetical protein
MSGKKKTAVAKSEASTKPAKTRSIPEIEAEIAASRDHLVETVEQLQVAVKRTLDPKRIITVQVMKVRGFYVDEYGGVRPDRVAGTVGVVVGIIVVRRVGKRVFSKD